ncbi:MAG: hypothetical protein AB7T07_12470 [Steroidobacteraceae bacterium]
MDREQIRSEQIVERYLTGDLLVREARDFERFCLEHPEVLETLAIPARLKARLSIKPFDGTDTSVFPAIPSSVTRIAAATGLQTLKPEGDTAETDGDEDDRVNTGSGKPNKLLLVLLLLALGAAGTFFWQTQTQQKEIKKLSVAAKALKIQAPGAMQTLRIVPSEAQTDQAHAAVSLNQAQMLDIHLDVSGMPYTSFAMTIDKVDEARIMQIRRIAADTNKELRFGLNSSAFGAGQYEIKLQGYNYKGQASDVGWVLLDLQ